MKSVLLFCFITIPGLFFYLPIFQYYFSQDDFIHLYASKAQNFSQFLNFFNPFFQFPDIFFYRPLATQVYFFINHTLFGLNTLPFRMEALLIHLVNSILFYLIISKLWKNQKIALISATLYNISAVHFLSLYYISAFQQILRTFFIFLAILAFIKFKESKRKSLYLSSVTAFIASLLSKETSIILPGLLFLLCLYDQKLTLGNIKKALYILVPFILTLILYFLMRLTGFQSIFGAGSYESASSVSEVIQNLRWYVLWSFGLPEILSTYPSIKPQSILQFIKDFQSSWIIVASFGILVATSLPFWLKKNLPNKEMIFLSMAIFLLSISPVLLLSQHRYPQYLDVAFLGFLPLLTWPIYQAFFCQKTLSKISYAKILNVIFILSFITLQYFSLKLTETTHWTTNRSKIAYSYLIKTSNIQTSTTGAETVVFTGNSKQLKELSNALTGKYALLVWFPDKVKNVLYSNTPPDNSPATGKIIFTITGL